MTIAIQATDRPAGGLLKSAAGGLLSGMATPLMQPLIDWVQGGHADFRVALLALPFALLVLLLVSRAGWRWWFAVPAALVTVGAFVCAVNVAIFVDAQAFDLGRFPRTWLAGLAGGCTGAAVMALGISVLIRSWAVLAWLPMLVVGTLAGSLLALDNSFDFGLFSVLYPVWQAGVATGLTLALQRCRP